MPSGQPRGRWSTKEERERASLGDWKARRGPNWGAKRGQKVPGSGSKPRTPSHGSPMQLERQFKAFEFHVRSFTNKEIAELLNCRVDTVIADIRFEFERRQAIYASGRESFVQRSFYALEAVKQMNFEVLTKNNGESKSGHEYKSIIAAIALQSRLMGYDAPKRVDARIEGSVDIGHFGLEEVTRQLPESVSTAILYAIAESAGRGDDPRLATPQWNLGNPALGPGQSVVEHIGPAGEVDLIESRPAETS